MVGQSLRLRTGGQRYATDWNKRFAISTAQLVDFLKSMRDRVVPAWQRHQAALTAARYQMMLTGRMDVELGHVVQKLADLAHAERKGDPSRAAQETRFPANEPKVITALRQTLRRRRYKCDTEKAYVGWCQRFLQANPGKAPPIAATMHKRLTAY